MLSTSSLLLWPIFLTIVSSLLLVDLLVLNRKDHKPTVKQAALESLGWIGISVIMGVIIWLLFGATNGAQYFTGYIIEKALSVDNIFVWGVVLSFFAIPDKLKHRVLFWGVFGAIIMRFIFIMAGVQIIDKFSIAIPILGLVLLWSAYKVLKSGDDEDDMDVSQTRTYKFFTKYVPTTKKLDGHKFLTRQNGKLLATPLLLCLLVVEVTDVIFAVDSVPAILAVSNHTFVIFASNVMAILGLRALFFLFDAIKDKFEYLGTGVGIVLAAIGLKMLASSHFGIGPVHLPGYHVPTIWSLVFIAAVLIGSVLASVIKGKLHKGE